MEETLVNIGLIVAYVMTGIALGGMIIFEIIYLATNIADAKGTLGGIGALILILGLSWALGSSEFDPVIVKKFEMTSKGLKLVDAGLFTTYVLIVLATVGLVVDLVMSFTKR